jgi:hypothetical protein
MVVLLPLDTIRVLLVEVCKDSLQEWMLHPAANKAPISLDPLVNLDLTPVKDNKLLVPNLAVLRIDMVAKVVITTPVCSISSSNITNPVDILLMVVTTRRRGDNNNNNNLNNIRISTGRETPGPLKKLKT